MLRNFVEPLGMLLLTEVEYHSYTLPEEREEMPQFDEEDVIDENGFANVPIHSGMGYDHPITINEKQIG